MLFGYSTLFLLNNKRLQSFTALSNINLVITNGFDTIYRNISFYKQIYYMKFLKKGCFQRSFVT